MHARALSAAAIAAALVLLPTAAHAAGSDSPTPYTVTAAGLTLPAGTTFEANGHINYRVTAPDGTGERSFNVHQSIPHNNVWPRAAYVGQGFYPWTDHPDFSAAFPDGYCVTWVQVSLYNEHFGEGGQAPVCTDPGTPVEPTDPTGPGEPSEPTDPTDPTEPTDPTPPTEPTTPTEPTDPIEPTHPTEPTDPGEPTAPTEPSIPLTPVDPGLVTPVDPGPVTPVDPTSPTSPGATVDLPTVQDEVLSTEDSFQSEVLSAGRLAATGTATESLIVLGLVALVAGTALVVLVGRRDDDETEG